MSEGWGTWEEERCYPAKDGKHLITVFKRTQNYGEPMVFWKNTRRKLTADERQELVELESVRRGS